MSRECIIPNYFRVNSFEDSSENTHTTTCNDQEDHLAIAMQSAKLGLLHARLL